MLHLIFILHRSNIAVKNLEDILLKSVGPALVLDPRLYKALFSCLLAFAWEKSRAGGGYQSNQGLGFSNNTIVSSSFFIMYAGQQLQLVLFLSAANQSNLGVLSHKISSLKPAHLHSTTYGFHHSTKNLTANKPQISNNLKNQLHNLK